MMKDAPLEALKRPNLQGKTPYHVAAELEDARFLEQLLRKIPGKDHIGKPILKEEEAKNQNICKGGAGGERDEQQKGEITKQSDKVGDVNTSNNIKDEGDGAEQDNDEEEEEPEKDEKNREEASDWIFIKDSRGRSPIFNTCEKLNLPALELLLDAGFDPDEEDREGVRPMQEMRDKFRFFISERATALVMSLLRSSEKVRRRTHVISEDRDNGSATISQAGIEIRMQNKRIDWDIISSIKSTETPKSERSAATKEDHKPLDPVLDGLVESLKKEAEKKKDVDGNILSVISWAVEEGNAEQLDLLLRAGISPEIKDATGITPYQRAYKDEREDLVIKLIDAGADFESKDPDGEAAIVKAVQDNRIKVAISMIKARAAIIHTRESNGMRSTFHIAAENNNWELLSQLLDSADDIDVNPMHPGFKILLDYDNNNWELLSHLLDSVDEKNVKCQMIPLDYDNHASSADCQSFLVHLAKAGQLEKRE